MCPSETRQQYCPAAHSRKASRSSTHTECRQRATRRTHRWTASLFPVLACTASLQGCRAGRGTLQREWSRCLQHPLFTTGTPCPPSTVAIAAPTRSPKTPPKRMRPSWTGRPSSSPGMRAPTTARCTLRHWIADSNSGLVLASGYLSTAPPVDYSFAFDKPLHTVAVVLLLTGLAIVAIEAWACRCTQPPPPPRYIAIPLGDGQSWRPTEEIWTEAGAPTRRRAWSVKAVGALLAVLLFAVCGRIAIFYRVIKDVECSGPSATVRTSPHDAARVHH
jgi:hypothetical protein